MAKSIWVVLDVEDDNNIIGTFSSLKKMLKSLDEKYTDVCKTYDMNGQMLPEATAYLNVADGMDYNQTFEIPLLLRRYKVDSWYRRTI